uniref:small monomeric GTPase n=2 Tax=Gasterosteus aculeatus aculeatus TaxID=481459 RepID=A0AAQ4S4N2_GASAC|nr:ras-related protein Rab-15-like isoform X1 [Gasterosteus aculeatus aculeatus]
MAKQYDVLFRLLMLGDSGVGKTCMLRRFTESYFDSSHISTIGVDFKMRTLELDGTRVRVQIWDTAGQERYQTITKQYYRRAQGIIFVYDITSESSFQHLVKWAGDVDEVSAPRELRDREVIPSACLSCLLFCCSTRRARCRRSWWGTSRTRRRVGRYRRTKEASWPKPMGWSSLRPVLPPAITSAFTRMTQLVLRAHERDVDDLLGSLDDYLEKASLEEEKGGDAQKTCAC